MRRRLESISGAALLVGIAAAFAWVVTTLGRPLAH